MITVNWVFILKREAREMVLTASACGQKYTGSQYMNEASKNGPGYK